VLFPEFVKKPGSPDVPSDHGDDIGKGCLGLVVPGGRTDANGGCPENLQGHEHYQREQSEQNRGGSLYGQVRLLSLRFNTEMGSELFKGNLHIPSQDEPMDDLLGTGFQGCGEESLCSWLTLGATCTGKDPVDLNRILSGSVPQGGTGYELQGDLDSVIPHGFHGRPLSGRIFGPLSQRELPLALLWLRSSFAGNWSRRRIIKGGIQSQT